MNTQAGTRVSLCRSHYEGGIITRYQYDDARNAISMLLRHFRRNRYSYFVEIVVPNGGTFRIRAKHNFPPRKVSPIAGIHETE